MRKIGILVTLLALIASYVPMVAVPVLPQVDLVQAQTSPLSLPLFNPNGITSKGSFTYDWPDGAGGDISYGGSAVGVSEDGQNIYIACNVVASQMGIAKLRIPALGGRATPVQPCSGPNSADFTKILPNRDGGSPRLGGILEQGGRTTVTGYWTYDANGSAIASHWSGSSLTNLSGPYLGAWKSGSAAANLNVKTTGFVKDHLTPIPAEWQSTLGGPALSTAGYTSIISRASYGASVSVFDPATVTQNGFQLNMLLGCPDPIASCRTYGTPTSNNYNGSELSGGAFIVPGTRTLVAIERESSGPTCYGYTTNDPTLHGTPYPSASNPSPENVVWCYSLSDPLNQKGPKGYPYRLVAKLYDLKDLVDVKNGVKNPWDVRQYMTYDMPGSSAGESVSSGSYNPVTKEYYLLRYTGGGVNTVAVYGGFNNGNTGGDTSAPTVSLTAPANGATVSGSGVTVSANASDNVGVAGVQFKVDGNNVGTEDATSPYSITWNSASVGNGSHTVTATARDASGNTGTSSAVTVIVNNSTADTTAPTVSMTAPANGATVSGSAVSVSANASDNVGVAGVQFRLDGANLGTEDTAAPYSVSWNSTGVSNGSHALTAVARDAAGNTATSSTVSVTVNNQAANKAPIGNFDEIRLSDGMIRGWTLDEDAKSTANQAHIYIDGPAGSGGTLLWGGPTNVLRTDVNNAYGATGNHGFEYSIPASYRNGASHSVYVYGVDTSNSAVSTLLAGSPKSFNLTMPDGVMPTVSMTAPADNSTVSGASVAVSASASDNVGVAGVQFKLNGVNLGAEDTSAPYAYIWNTTGASNSIHTLSATARDAAGNTATASITVTVNNNTADTTKPWSNIIDPANGATVSGTAVNVAASAVDNVGVAGVQFKLDGNNLGAEDATSPYNVTWNTTTASNGSHALTATARDAAGNVFTSDPKTVTVNNSVANRSPIGNFDEIRLSDGVFRGWALDLDDKAFPVVVHYYVDGPYNAGGTIMGGAATDTLRTDVNNTYVATGNHGFEVTIPAKYRDGKSHSLYLYALDSLNVATPTLLPGSGKTFTLSAADTTAPTVSVTAPADNSTVSGTAVNVAANASDNVGVVGVQFKLNGANLGAEDTTAPYSYTWNTTVGASDSLHTLTAVARDAAGNTAASAITVRVNNQPTAPAAPSSLAAAAQSESEIKLAWTDNSSNESGFRIERRFSVTGSWAEVGNAAANATTWSDTGLNANTTYHYRVAAENTAGRSAFSNEASAKTDSDDEVSNPPVAPSNLVAGTPTSTSVALTWSDNSSDETGFLVDRKTGTGLFTEIAIVGPNVKSYESAGLAPSTRYTFRVRAYNSSGNSSYSNEVSVTTASGTILPPPTPVPPPSSIPRDGKLIRKSGGQAIYVMEYGKKRAFTSWQVFVGLGYSYRNVGIASNFDSIPVGENISTSRQRHVRGAIVKGSDKTIYFMGAEQRYPFPSMEVFNSWGLSLAEVVTANSYDMLVPVGPVVERPLPGTVLSESIDFSGSLPVNSMVKGSGPQVYVVTGHRRLYPFASAAEAELLGYRLQDTVAIPDAYLIGYAVER